MTPDEERRLEDLEEDVSSKGIVILRPRSDVLHAAYMLGYIRGRQSMKQPIKGEIV